MYIYIYIKDRRGSIHHWFGGISMSCLFDYSRTRSKGSRFTLGVWGLSCVRQTLRNCPPPFATVRNPSQPFATVRECPREVAMAVPFGAFQPRLASFRVALRDIPTSLLTCQKSFLCGRHNTFATLSEDALHFSWQAQHFGDTRCHFAWQAQHFRRVDLRIFCTSHCQRCAKW